MKKYLILIFVFLFCVCTLFIGFSNNNYQNEKENKKYSSSISMMLESEAGSGNYEKITASSWPAEGYIFNKELSKCENGGELSWDDTNKRVLMSGNVSDKCYVYFDVEVKPVIKNVVFDVDGGAWGIQSMDIDTIRPISKYYIKVKNDNFTEFSIGIRSFCSPSYRGELTYYFYVVDVAGVSSDVFAYVFNNTDRDKTVDECPIV